MREKVFTKAESRQLRALAGAAYEREVAAALEDLERDFARWRSGEITAFDLSDAIHAFHNGQSRELWKLYNGLPVDAIVSAAVARGTLAQDEIPEPLRPRLERWAV